MFLTSMLSKNSKISNLKTQTSFLKTVNTSAEQRSKRCPNQNGMLFLLMTWLNKLVRMLCDYMKCSSVRLNFPNHGTRMAFQEFPTSSENSGDYITAAITSMSLKNPLQNRN